MTKRFFAWLLFIFMVFAVQTALLPLIHFHGSGPDLLLLVTCSAGFLYSRRKGAMTGFLLGLFQDLATGTFFGVNAFTKLLAGYCCGIFSNRVLRDSFFLPVSASAISTAAVFLVMELIMVLLGYRFNPIYHLQYQLFPVLCYNIVFAWPVHCLVRWMWNKTREKKQHNTASLY